MRSISSLFPCEGITATTARTHKVKKRRRKIEKGTKKQKQKQKSNAIAAKEQYNRPRSCHDDLNSEQIFNRNRCNCSCRLGWPVDRLYIHVYVPAMPHQSIWVICDSGHMSCVMLLKSPLSFSLLTSSQLQLSLSSSFSTFSLSLSLSRSPSPIESIQRVPCLFSFQLFLFSFPSHSQLLRSLRSSTLLPTK